MTEAAEAAQQATAPETADLLVFNTCSVRETAENKLRIEVDKLRPLKRARPSLLIAVAGCVAQAEGAELGGGVLRLHAHDLEEGAVTAKATGQAQSRGCGGGFGGHGCTGGMHFVFGKRQRGRERTLMKLSNLPMLIVAVLLAGMVWIFFDMSRPMPASHGAAAGTVASAIAQSTAAKPVMVEFYADWCGPCKEIGPQVEEFAREVASRARVIRVNVDEDPKLGYDLGVRVIPTFVVFKNGKESARETGAIPKSRMRELLAQ